MKTQLIIFIILMFFSVSSMAEKEKCQNLSKSQAIAIAQKQIKGKVLSVTKTKRENHLIYKVKVLHDKGRVQTIVVDGCKGKIL